MKDEREKICEIQDPDKLRSVLIREKGGKVSCSICCAVSHDEADLCSPVKTPGTNLFCDL